jgi:predicted aminopeptidase
VILLPTGPGRTGGCPQRARRRLLYLALLLLLLPACNPFYVAQAGWAQARILSSRVPLTQVMTDPATDPVTRAKLRLVRDARVYAIEELGFQNVGDSYSTFARLESDTLALVLSAAYRDRLEFRTWWFPITGRVPYRAYFSTQAGERARDALEEQGFDTLLRPTAAFSTLGWFADPLYSTLLRLDEVGLVETVLHELAHNHLFIPGQGRFNESYATFVGHVAAVEFFCGREGGGPDTLKCLRARDRWTDALQVSRFLDTLESRIRELYRRTDLPADEILAARETLYLEAQADFRSRVQPELRAGTYAQFALEPLNNATLLARSLYYHRLPEFDELWKGWCGDFATLMAWLREEGPRLDDPFHVTNGELACISVLR